MENSKEQKSLGVIIDYKLNSKNHISELYKKASKKIAALFRLSSYLHYPEKKLIFNSIIKSQFSFCPLVWMFCSRTSNNMINKLHERSLRIILNDYLSNFNILLENNKDICNHHRNIQTLLIEVFKMKNELAHPIMESILNKRFNTYNLTTKRKKAVWYGLETLSYRYPQLWSLLPESLKEMNSLSQFKRNIKHWICRDCPCRLCKVYIQNLGVLQCKITYICQITNLDTISNLFIYFF